MKKQFHLEKVLDFRKRTLDREKAKLRDLVHQERLMLEQMAEIIEEIKNKRGEQDADAALGHFDFTDLYNKYIALRENDLEYIKKKKDEMRASIESQKQVIKKALSDVKIMEKLKEKHLAEYAAYVLKQEELQIDEINITKPRSEVF